MTLDLSNCRRRRLAHRLRRIPCTCNSTEPKASSADSFMSQLHVATQLIVGQLWKILGVEDCGFCKDTPLPAAVEVTQMLKILPHQNLHVFAHRARIQFEVFKQHTPPLLISFSRLQFTGCCRFERCKCCMLRCSTTECAHAA